MQNDEKSTVEDRGTLASGFTPDAENHLIPNSKEFADVDAFHEKFQLLRFQKPGHLTKGKLVERVEFMLEELLEFADAAGVDIQVTRDEDGEWYRHVEPGLSVQEQDMAGQADALVDLVYVALGTAVMLGLPWDWLWNDVQRANMAKVRGVTHRGHAVDVTKPPGWQGPQTQRILDLAGYNPNEEQRDDTQR